VDPNAPKKTSKRGNASDIKSKGTHSYANTDSSSNYRTSFPLPLTWLLHDYITTWLCTSNQKVRTLMHSSKNAYQSDIFYSDPPTWLTSSIVILFSWSLNNSASAIITNLRCLLSYILFSYTSLSHTHPYLSHTTFSHTVSYLHLHLYRGAESHRSNCTTNINTSLTHTLSSLTLLVLSPSLFSHTLFSLTHNILSTSISVQGGWTPSP